MERSGQQRGGFPRADAGESLATSRCFRDAPQRRYSAACIGAGLERLSTAPLASGTPEFRELERSLGLADEKGLVLYELMPERYEIAALLQQALARNADFFGIQLCGFAR